MPKSTDQWFAHNVLPLEGALTRYLRRTCRDTSEIEDLRQEIYVRVYEAAITRLPPAAAPFVFAVARNLLIDKLRRSRIVSIDFMADFERLNVFSDEVDAERVVTGRQELARLHEATLRLPPRCREVFRLRKIEGLSQRETAARLGIAEGTVEKQVAKAMRALASSFLGGLDGDGWTNEKKRSAHDDEIGNAN